MLLQIQCFFEIKNIFMLWHLTVVCSNRFLLFLYAGVRIKYILITNSQQFSDVSSCREYDRYTDRDYYVNPNSYRYSFLFFIILILNQRMQRLVTWRMQSFVTLRIAVTVPDIFTRIPDLLLMVWQQVIVGNLAPYLIAVFVDDEPPRRFRDRAGTRAVSSQAERPSRALILLLLFSLPLRS